MVIVAMASDVAHFTLSGSIAPELRKPSIAALSESGPKNQDLPLTGDPDCLSLRSAGMRPCRHGIFHHHATFAALSDGESAMQTRVPHSGSLAPCPIRLTRGDCWFQTYDSAVVT
jgi:hypothetical protein